MTLDKVITVAVVLAGSPAMAEEDLYCVDTQAVGFKWDNGRQVWQSAFREDRFTVKVVSDTQRIITKMVGDTAGFSRWYTCSSTWSRGIACNDGAGDMPWVFYRDTYTRAFLAGPPAGGTDQNIWIAYGTCTKF